MRVAPTGRSLSHSVQLQVNLDISDDFYTT